MLASIVYGAIWAGTYGATNCPFNDHEAVAVVPAEVDVCQRERLSLSDHWFEPLADHLGRAYLRYSFTKGTANEVDFLVDALALAAGPAGPRRRLRARPPRARAGRAGHRGPRRRHLRPLRRAGPRGRAAAAPASSGWMPGPCRSTGSSTPSSRCARARSAWPCRPGPAPALGRRPGRRERRRSRRGDPGRHGPGGEARRAGRVLGVLRLLPGAVPRGRATTSTPARGSTTSAPPCATRRGPRPTTTCGPAASRRASCACCAGRAGLTPTAIWSVTPGAYAARPPDLDHPEFLVIAKSRERSVLVGFWPRCARTPSRAAPSYPSTSTSREGDHVVRPGTHPSGACRC